jgi:hypothetical protein
MERSFSSAGTNPSLIEESAEVGCDAAKNRQQQYYAKENVASLVVCVYGTDYLVDSGKTLGFLLFYAALYKLQRE